MSSAETRCRHELESLAAWLDLAGDVVVRKITVNSGGGQRGPAVRVLNPINAHVNVTVLCCPDPGAPQRTRFTWLDGRLIPAATAQEAAACVRFALGMPPYEPASKEVKRVAEVATRNRDHTDQWVAESEVTRATVLLLCDLALALLELGRASRLHIEVNGRSALMVWARPGTSPVAVVARQDQGRWLFLWSGAQPFPVTDRDASVRGAAARLVGVSR